MRLAGTIGYVCLQFAAWSLPCRGNNLEMPTIAVRLVNSSSARNEVVRKAAAEATWVFDRAGLKVAWVDCPSEVDDLPASDACSESASTFSVAIIERPPEFLRATGLGFALVHSGNRNHGAVVYPRVADLGKAYPSFGGIDLALALAIAHELGHLILGSTAHSASGLLQGTCRAAELQAFAQRRLRFSPAEAAVMRSRAAKWR